MEIKSGGKYPSNALSNFAPHPFYIDGVLCNSMEGFLQSLKFKSIDMQIHVCTLVGKAAKSKGAKKNWQRKQTLWWKGKPIKRESDEYQNLIYKAYSCLAKNDGFARALLSTKNSNLTHSIGNKDPKKTILTEREFCSILKKIRYELQKK